MFDIDNIIEYCFIKTLSEEWPKNVHERTFVSRMAHYLVNEIEKIYNSIKVDVEYNRIMNDVKRVDDLNKEWNILPLNSDKYE